MHIRIGTRKSQLALAQVDEFTKLLKNHTYEIIPITTSGDKILDRPLYDIGGKALFLKELEQALIGNKIDVAVHSFKDVPAHLPNGLIIGGILKRGIPNDALISFKAQKISDLPQNAKIGTSSVRRKAQLKVLRPDLELVDCRGNVTSRMQKFQQGFFDAIILAAAGLERLNMFDPAYCSIIPEEEMLPAVGQGAISLEMRKDDERMKAICNQANDKHSCDLIRSERGFLETINGDCRTIVAALAKDIGENKAQAKFLYSKSDSIKLQTSIQTFDIADGYAVGSKIAKAMLIYGAVNKVDDNLY